MNKKSEELFAEIAVFGAFPKTLHYRVPDELIPLARVGARVLVPLGKREASGLILALHSAPPEVGSDIVFRPLRTVLDPAPVVPDDLLGLCRWISRYYFYPLGEVLQVALPSEILTSPKTCFRLTAAGQAMVDSGSADELMRFLAKARQAGLDSISQALGPSSHLPATLKSLERMGQVERFYDWVQPVSSPRRIKTIRLLSHPEPGRYRTSPVWEELIELLERSEGHLPVRVLRQSVRNAGVRNMDYWVRKLARDGFLQLEEVEEISESHCSQTLPPCDAPPELTQDQREAVAALLPAMTKASFEPFVLHGVTGSGKTEIYLRLAEEALQRGRGALVLVPEIALSTQMEALFRRRFETQLAVWHSGLSAQTRHDQWREILSGRRLVVLGVRSAVFMPVCNPGIIVVDEEHDGSYKQEDRLRYHARDVALMRAKVLGIPILLGSATPSLQSLHNCRIGRYRQIELVRRVFDRPMPEIQLVDMKRESRQHRIISHSLQQAISETLSEKAQALVFLNRRGFAKHTLCTACGHVIQCAHCSVSMTYHQKDDILRCHYCGWEKKLPQRCPGCNASGLSLHGFGTERVEEELRRLFPGARTVRVDRDTASRAEPLLERLNAVRSRRADILIGTQMVAKGHDFPHMTLVGIVNADTALQLPDYRAGETTVQLLMQVTGRAGRGERPGRVILQTYNPHHHTIQAVMKMDYTAFCQRELESRSQLQYPPFTRLARLLVTGTDAEAVHRAALELASLCREESGRLRELEQHIAVLGPAAAPLPRLGNRHRWQLFIKAWTSRDLQQFCEAVLRLAVDTRTLRGVQLIIDRDPMTST